VMSYQNGVSDFFLTPYRAWEFLGGSLLAWWHYDRGHEEDVPIYREVMSWIGLILLGVSFRSLGDENPYPGWRALIPASGTLLLIEGGHAAWVNRKILSNPAVVWIGLISYPLYLFHWPILSFLHIVKGENVTATSTCIALIAALVLTICTYYLFEVRIRYNKSKYIVPTLALLFLSIGLSGVSIWFNIYKKNKQCDLEKIEIAIRDDKMLKGLPVVWGKNGICILKIGGNGLQTLFFGDSNMQQYAVRIEKLVKNNQELQRGAIFVTGAGSPPIPNITGAKRNTCSEMLPTMWKYVIEDKRIDRVVITALWPRYFDSDAKYFHKNISTIHEGVKSHAIEDFGIEVDELVKRGKKVTVVLSIPYDLSLDPASAINRSFFGIKVIAPPAIKTKDFFQKHRDLLKKISEISVQHGCVVIDPINFLSTNSFCIFSDNGIPIRFNAGHLRPGYVRDNVRYLDFTVDP